MTSPTPNTLPSPDPHPGFGSGKQIWLVRHAQVHADHKGQEYGALDVALSAEGLERSEELALQISAQGPGALLSSPLQRARHMGEHLARASGLRLGVDERLTEIDRGAWSGRLVEELQVECAADIRAFYADPWGWRGHGGENDEMLARRVWPALQKGLQLEAGGPLVITTHYNVVRVIVACALGAPPPRSFNLRLDPARMVVLKDGPGGWHLLYSNIHQPPELPASEVLA